MEYKRTIKKIACFILMLILITSTLASTFASNESIYAKVNNCFQTKNQREYVTKKVAEIIEEFNLKSDDAPLAIFFFDGWIGENIKYDDEHFMDFVGSRRTAYSALTEGYTVCVGFAQLVMEFCRQLDIPCEYVHLWDKSETEFSHIINMVYIEETESWYYWDATSGTVLIGSQYAENIYRDIEKQTCYYNNSDKKVDTLGYSDRLLMDEIRGERNTESDHVTKPSKNQNLEENKIPHNNEPLLYMNLNDNDNREDTTILTQSPYDEILTMITNLRQLIYNMFKTNEVSNKLDTSFRYN